MRKISFFILLTLWSNFNCFGQLTSKTDVRFELTSIVCRLAEAEEYMQCKVPDYSKAVDEYFRAYVNHPAVKYLRQIREDDGIGYNAISSLAYALEIRSGNIRLQAQFDLRENNDDTPLSDIDDRWTKATLTHFVELLNDFYKKSHFEKFYKMHMHQYEFAQEQLDKILSRINEDWFQDFYGKTLGEPEIFISMCNGSSNYALSSRSTYGILIGCNSVRDGLPTFADQTLPTIIHEFNHYFANPFAFFYAAQMQESVTTIYSYVKEQLEQSGYNDDAILPEWLTRLFTIMYFKENDEYLVPAIIMDDCSNGFIWQDRATAFMEYFYRNREKNHTIDSFIPQLVAFFNYTASQMREILKEYENRYPYIVNVFPAVGSEIDLEDMKEIEIFITFSEPMSTNASGWGLLATNPQALNSDIYSMSEWTDEYTYGITLPVEKISKAGIYGFILRSAFFQNVKKYPVKENFKVTYKIKSQ